MLFRKQCTIFNAYKLIRIVTCNLMFQTVGHKLHIVALMSSVHFIRIFPKTLAMHQFRSSAELLAFLQCSLLSSLYFPRLKSSFEPSTPDCGRSAGTKVARRATLDSDEGSDAQREMFLAAVWLSFSEAAR